VDTARDRRLAVALPREFVVAKRDLHPAHQLEAAALAGRGHLLVAGGRVVVVRAIAESPRSWAVWASWAGVSDPSENVEWV